MQLCDLLPTTAFVHWENGTSLFMLSRKRNLMKEGKNNGIKEESQIKERRSL